MKAIKIKNENMARMLMKRSDLLPSLMLPNNDGKYPLHMAIEKQLPEVAKLLIEKLTLPNLQEIIQGSKIHPLSLAIKRKLITVADNMIAKLELADLIKASKEEKNVDGTPLHVAVTSGQKDLLSKMIAKLTNEQVMTKACKHDASPLPLRSRMVQQRF